MKKLVLIAILGLSQAACVHSGPACTPNNPAASGACEIVGADGVANGRLVRVGSIETPESAAQAAAISARAAD